MFSAKIMMKSTKKSGIFVRREKSQNFGHDSKISTGLNGKFGTIWPNQQNRHLNHLLRTLKIGNFGSFQVPPWTPRFLDLIVPAKKVVAGTDSQVSRKLHVLKLGEFLTAVVPAIGSWPISIWASWKDSVMILCSSLVTTHVPPPSAHHMCHALPPDILLLCSVRWQEYERSFGAIPIHPVNSYGTKAKPVLIRSTGRVTYIQLSYTNSIVMNPSIFTPPKNPMILQAGASERTTRSLGACVPS